MWRRYYHFFFKGLQCCIVWVGQSCAPIGREGIIIPKCTSHSSNLKALKIVRSPEVTFFNWFVTIISFKNPNQSTQGNLRWISDRLSSFYDGWIRGTLVYNNSFPPIVLSLMFLSVDSLLLVWSIEYFIVNVAKYRYGSVLGFLYYNSWV